MPSGKLMDHLRQDEQVAKTLLLGTMLHGGAVLATLLVLVLVVAALFVMQ